MSTTEIAIKLKLKHAGIISSYLHQKKYHKLELDDEYTLEAKTYLQGKTRHKANLEKGFQKIHQIISYKEYLYKKYIEEKNSQAEIGACLGLDTRTVCGHLNFYGIKKSKSQARKKQ